jgi:hypothetical protein
MDGVKSAGCEGVVGAVLLGGNSMPAASPDVNRSSREEQVTSALSFMGEALVILDELGDTPELAARLDEIIERLNERAGLPADASGSGVATA